MTKINVATKMRVEQYKVVANNSKDGTLREVDLELGLTRDQANKALGEQLTSAVFAGYTTDEDSAGEWKLKNPKPSKRVVCQQHNVRIDGDGFVVQPKLRAFKTVDDTEKVVALIRLHLGQAQTALRRKLEDTVGNEVMVEIEPTNMDLPLGETSNLSDRQLEIIKGGTKAVTGAPL